MTVSFAKAADDGGARIATYHARCTSKDGGIAAAHDRASSPIRVPGLTSNRTYTCTVAARNNVGLGPASRPSRMVVVRPTVPAAPTNTSVKAGVHGVVVAFSRPSDDGGAPIAIYQARCNTRGGATSTHDGTTSPISVSGLAANATYICTVAASNNVGFGSASRPSRPVVAGPTAPGAPKIRSVRAGTRSVTIAFTAPTKDGGAPIQSYRAVCTSKNGGVPRAQNAPNSPDHVSLMTGGATYTCTVAASNYAGAGPASAPSKPFVPRSH